MTGCEDITGGAGAIALGALLIYLWKKGNRAVELAARLPVSPAAQVREGMVQLVGRAAGQPSVRSAIRGIDCLVTKSELEYLPDQSDPEWGTEFSHHQSAPFYFEDASGRVLVDPSNAELKLLPGVLLETEKKSAWSWRQRNESALESRLRDMYFELRRDRNGLAGLPRWMTQAALAGHKKLSKALDDPVIAQLAAAAGTPPGGEVEDKQLRRQYEQLVDLVRGVRTATLRGSEWNILPGEAIYIVGPALNSPPGGPWSEPIVIRKEHPSDTFVIASGTPQQAHESIRKTPRLLGWTGVAFLLIGIYMTWQCL